MDLKEMGVNARNLVDLAQNHWRAFENVVLNVHVPEAIELVSKSFTKPHTRLLDDIGIKINQINCFSRVYT